MWAESSEADAGAGLVAVVAPFLAEVAGFAGLAMGGFEKSVLPVPANCVAAWVDSSKA